MRTIGCTTCGAPLSPGAHEVRVRCGHCGATVEVTSEGVTRAAAALQRAGIRVPERPMTMDDIQARIAEREATARAARKQAIVISGVCMGIAAVVVVAVLMLAGGR